MKKKCFAVRMECVKPKYYMTKTLLPLQPTSTSIYLICKIGLSLSLSFHLSLSFFHSLSLFLRVEKVQTVNVEICFLKKCDNQLLYSPTGNGPFPTAVTLVMKLMSTRWNSNLRMCSRGHLKRRQASRICPAKEVMKARVAKSWGIKQ